MFTQTDGPTALRNDMVRALSFSMQEIQLGTSAGLCEAVCGIAGVWNDSKGAVVLVVYYRDPARADRYAFADPIDSYEALDEAVDLALGFAEGMGFMMDSPEFLGLGQESMAERLRSWDAIRKVRRKAAARPARAPDPRGRQGERLPPGARTRTAPAEDDAVAGRAILGRIQLVQRRGGERSVLSPWARLRSNF